MQMCLFPVISEELNNYSLQLITTFSEPRRCKSWNNKGLKFWGMTCIIFILLYTTTMALPGSDRVNKHT